MTFAQRYARQLVLPGFGREAQERLAASRVLVIGAGGLGSSVIPALAAAGVGTIGIVDDDTVELSNLARQTMHGVDDLGGSKVESAAETVARIDPAIVVRAHPLRFSAENAARLLEGYDLLVDGSDNFPTRYLADDAATLAAKPLVWGSVNQYGGQTSVSFAAHGPTYRDLFPAPPPADSVLSCEQGGVFPATVAIVGSIMTAEVIKLLTGVGRPLLGRVSLYDALSGRFRELEYQRDPTAAPITGFIDYELFCGVAPRSDEVDARELAALLDEVVLLDVREPWEAEVASLPGAVLVPLGSLRSAVATLPTDRPIVAYCHHGVRSAHALELLRAAGFDDARHLTGGIDAWSRTVDASVARY